MGEKTKCSFLISAVLVMSLVAFSNKQMERFLICGRKEREFLCEKV